jgi:hypothetical protein
MYLPTVGVYADAQPAVVPEPSTIVLLGLGLAASGLGSLRARRRRHA